MATEQEMKEAAKQNYSTEQNSWTGQLPRLTVIALGALILLEFFAILISLM